jgi:hypothetical protein
MFDTLWLYGQRIGGLVIPMLNTPLGLIAFGLAAIAILWLVSRVVRLPLLRTILFLPAAACLAVIGLFGLVLWGPVRNVTGLLLRIIPLDRAVTTILVVPTWFSSSLLVRGERRKCAEAIWAPARFPDLYETVPADIARPVYEDGRLLGGVPMRWLADRLLTQNAYRSAVRIGLEAGVLFFVITFVPTLVLLLFDLVKFISSLLSGDQPIVEQWPMAPPVRFSALELFEANFKVEAFQLLRQMESLVIYLPAQALIGCGVAILTAVLLINSWFREKASPYRLVTKDSEVRWPFRIEARNILRQTFIQQLHHAIGHLKGKSTYIVGSATGTLRARGDLAAPMRDQDVMLDQESLFQHVLVFGGTGEGKTTALLKPLMRKVLRDRHFGAFISDAKGVLWRDAMKIAKDVDRADDVVLIGTGPGQFGVNIVADLTPSQVSAALRSVLTQIGSGGKDSFWPDMAAGVLRHMLTLGRGFLLTDAGKVQATKSVSPYSLWWAYQAVLRPDYMKEAIDHIRATHAVLIEQIKEAATDAEAAIYSDRDRDLMTPELNDTIAYLQSAWTDMASETKTGIVANVTQLLDGFASSTALRERFASGRVDACISMREALDGKLVVNTLSSIEDGLPARLVSILIKTSLYREARHREATWKKEGSGQDPQSQPCLVVMDEVQELVTSDPTSGLSDASFWNVARSSGLAGLFATQTVAALKQTLGDDAAGNFMQQARSKVFFRTEERATVEYACWCAGEYERNRVFEDRHRESVEYRALIDGWDPLEPVNEAEEIVSSPWSLFSAARALLAPEGRKLPYTYAQAAFEPDYSHVPQSTGSDSSHAHSTYLAAMQAHQAATWRAEDLSREYRTEGNDRQQALSASDIIHMGRWHAFAHIQRAGAVRQDLIVVTHDFS